MLELTPEQARTLSPDEAITMVVNPKTREEFVLIRKDRYDVMQMWIAPLKRRWDNPADDNLIKKEAPSELTYGLIGWAGDPEVVHRIALDPEFGILESP